MPDKKCCPIPIPFIILLLFMISCKNTAKYEVDNEVKDTLVQQIAEEKPEKSLEIDLKITGRSAGTFELGQELYEQKDGLTFDVTKEMMTTITDEGPVEETVYIVRKEGKEYLQLRPQFDYETMQYTNHIGEILIFSESYKTEKQIGVRSTISEFTKAYPKHKIWYTYVSGMFVLETPEIAAQFILDPKDFTGDVSNSFTEMTALSTRDFRKSAKIVKVRLFKSDL